MILPTSLRNSNAKKRFKFPIPLVFGVVGDAFKTLKYPLAPLVLVLALVLGDLAESSFRQAKLLSGGSNEPTAT